MRVVHCPYVLWPYRLPTYGALSKHASLEVYFVEKENSLGSFDERSLSFQCKKSFGVRSYTWRWLAHFALLRLRTILADVLLLEWNSRNLTLVPATVAARLLRRRVVWWGHGEARGPGGLARRFSVWLGRWLPSAVVVYTPTVRAKLIQDNRYMPTRCFVAPNSLDTRRIEIAIEKTRSESLQKTSSCAGSGATKKSFTLIYSGRLVSGRDLEDIVEAVSALRLSNRDVSAVFVGDGEARGQLEKLAEERGVSHYVRFAGAVYDYDLLAQFYNEASLAIIPGWLGLSLVQAMAFGLPVVTADNSSLHNPEIDFFRDGITGKFYRYKDIVDLTSVVEQLFDDDQLRVKMGQAAQAYVSAHLSTEAMVAGLLEALAVRGSR